MDGYDEYVVNWPTKEYRISVHPNYYPDHERWSVENWQGLYYNGPGDDMTPVGGEWVFCGYFSSEKDALAYVEKSEL